MKALAICFAVLALAACGGSSSGATLTKAQYDAKLSRLCLVAADQFRELHMNNSLADWRHYAADVSRIERHFDDALAALKPPKELAGGATLFLVENHALLDDDGGAAAAARAGDRASFREYIDSAREDARSSSITAKRIGATGCYIG